MKKIKMVAIICAGLCANAAFGISTDELAQGFENPPKSAQPHTWWHWMDGNITKEGITADLEAMKEVGIGGAQIFNAGINVPHGPVEFNSPQWIDLVKHAAAEARRLNLELAIHNCAGWTASGGPWITPEKSMKILTTSERQVKGPSTFSDRLEQPPSKLDFYRDIAVLAFPSTSGKEKIPNFALKACLGRRDRQTVPPDTESKIPLKPGEAVQAGQIQVLTAAMKSDGSIVWQVPQGDWTIFRIGYTTNGRENAPAPADGRGLECDKLSRDGIEAHWNAHIAKIVDALGPLAGNFPSGLNNVVIDSFEKGTQNWTAGLEKTFRERYGYDITPFLPVLVGRYVDSREETERFLWDFRRLVADLFAQNYAGGMADLAHRNNLKFSCEHYGNFTCDDLQYGTTADIPMGEFWTGIDWALESLKPAASVGHALGRPIIGAEAFTANPGQAKWQNDPYSLKSIGDRAFCLGINRFIFHRFAHQPWVNPARLPGMTMGPYGTHLDRTVTWWKQGRAWFAYLARCQYLLQAGKYAADACLYVGADAPGVACGKMPEGYGFDYCDTTILRQMRVKEGILVLPSGMSYRMLVLSQTSDKMPLEVLRTIAQLAEAGATIIGQKPDGTPSLWHYPEADAEVRKLADSLWPDKIRFTSVDAALKAQNLLPDFEYSSEETKLTFIHRHAGEDEVYFVANPKKTSCEVPCTFRVAGKTPELWDPVTGEHVPAPVYSTTNGRTTLPLRFEPAGSVFVVFRSAGNGNHVVSVKAVVTKPAATTVYPLEIVKAEYGFFGVVNGKTFRDVTKRVRDILRQGKHEILANNTLAGSDPAENVGKELIVNYTLNGETQSARVKENNILALPEGANVTRARYGVIDESQPEPPAAIVDVTKTLAAAVRGDSLKIEVDNQLSGKDPAFGTYKKLNVTYRYRGNERTISANENTLLILPEEKGCTPPAYELAKDKQGNLFLRAWDGVSVDVLTASGKTLHAAVPNPALIYEISGPWQLAFPLGWGAPAEITLPRLDSWTENKDDGVKYFSGTATYRKSFIWTSGKEVDERVLLDLGEVKNLAEITLNGHTFPVLWKPPFRLDATGALQKGSNQLEIRVTNLWPNRLIGDDKLPQDCDWDGEQLKAWPKWVLEGKPSPTGRHTFATWRLWHADDPLLPSGLFGPVVLRTVKEIPFR